MTLVAVWRTQNRLMAIADTRITRSAGNVLTEHGPKILPMSIVCREPDVTGDLNRISFHTKIGFAYSGSTLSALSAHALADTLMSNLVSLANTPPPSLQNIAQFFRNIAAEYMREVAQLADRSGLFSALIFGFCHRTKKFQGFEVRPLMEGGNFSCDLIEHDFQNDNSIAIIGSRPELLRKRIEDDRTAALARGDIHPVLDIDRPARALQSIINEGLEDSVGGAIQQGWATIAGFEIVAKMMPITPRPPSPRNAGLFVLGFDIMDIQQIGAHQVILGGR
jgi:hypothetical protein